MSSFWILLVLGIIYIAIPVLLLLVAPKKPSKDDLYRRKTAFVLVLGDLDRSPRMNYHAQCLAKGGLDVTLCGYAGADYSGGHERITVVPFPVVARNGLPWIVFAVKKVVLQHWYLFSILKRFRNVDFLIVQNPPSIPVLGMVRFFVLFMSQRTRLAIDWHNLGYSILSLKLGPKHPFVIVHKWYERIFGRIAYVHFTVSVAMAEMLRADFAMNATRMIPLHDRPGPQFHPLTDQERQTIIKKYSSSIFEGYTEKERVIITATSYTPDEDLYVLLDALKAYSHENKNRSRPPLRVIVTGKGPMKAEMEAAFEKLALPDVKVISAWLPAEDYPIVLGAADLGVSLHQSSSGWDLPMKVVDMFGCGVPVVSVAFPALSELVTDGENGLVVNNSAEMARAFGELFGQGDKLAIVKKGAMEESRYKFEEHWNRKVGPLFHIGEYERNAARERQEQEEEEKALQEEKQLKQKK